MTIGLYFGTFNPIHTGHLIIANHIVEHTNLDKIWFVVTPHNPLKNKKTLLDNYQRLEMVHMATSPYDKLEVSNIEFSLPQPNYTINTLEHIKEKHPNHTFALIMGEDNLKSLHKWKNFELLLKNYEIYVYPRVTKLSDNNLSNHSSIHFVDAPIVEISSTHIRKNIKEGKNIEPLLPHSVWKYIDEMNFYKG
jgi:nicotinate-nucleotide adenylyltransferase